MNIVVNIRFGNLGWRKARPNHDENIGISVMVDKLLVMGSRIITNLIPFKWQ